jgi:hypothetical protein
MLPFNGYLDEAYLYIVLSYTMNWHSKVPVKFRWQEVFAILEQCAAKAASNNHHILKRNAYHQSIAR